jgi:carbon-monoxide dehydrogenase small subunit
MGARQLEINLRVNGEAISARVEARKTLVDFLRDDLSLTGTHVGCEHGVCGACTVLLDGAVIRGCLMLAVQCDGAEVQTIEGLSDSGAIADLQRAFEDRNALQCGYCTPGMLISANDLLVNGQVLVSGQVLASGQVLVNGHVPSRDTIREHLAGNYCRCTGYQAIVDAIEAVARARSEKKARPS